MSLYNLMHGVNPLATPLMLMLNLNTDDVGRFRDCYLAKSDEGEIQIHVYTRNGGGNREEYEGVFEELRDHPLYIRDFDDSFDCTYATIAFRVPEKFQITLKALVDVDPSVVPASPRERFESFMEKLRKDKNDPDVARVVEALEPIFKKISEKVEDS